MATITKNTTTKTAEKQKAAAFVNWEIPTKDGKVIKSDKGFTIFQNPEYPNPKEDLLVALANKHDGTVELNMKVRIVINGGTPGEVDLDNIALAD